MSSPLSGGNLRNDLIFGEKQVKWVLKVIYLHVEYNNKWNHISVRILANFRSRSCFHPSDSVVTVIQQSVTTKGFLPTPEVQVPAMSQVLCIPNDSYSVCMYIYIYIHIYIYIYWDRPCIYIYWKIRKRSFTISNHRMVGIQTCRTSPSCEAERTTKPGGAPIPLALHLQTFQERPGCCALALIL